MEASADKPHQDPNAIDDKETNRDDPDNIGKRRNEGNLSRQPDNQSNDDCDDQELK
jgi:hypothetical protein